MQLQVTEFKYHLTSGLSNSLKKLVDGLFQPNRGEYLSKWLNLLVIPKNNNKNYNQQNNTHACAYGVAVRVFEDMWRLQIDILKLK